jgi:hypothetical protein
MKFPLASYPMVGDTMSDAHLVRIVPTRLESRADTLRTFGTTEYFMSRQGSFIEQPFGREAFAASDGREAYLGSSHSRIVEAFDVAGGTVRKMSVDLRPSPLSVGDLLEATLLRLNDEPTEDSRARVRQVYAQAPLKVSKPFYNDLVLDRGGNLWLRTLELGASDSVRWHVVSNRGATEALINMPAFLKIFEIGDDYVLGVERRASRPERVVLYRLDKSRTILR